MKKLFVLFIALLVLGCKKDSTPTPLDLNGTFVGTVSGWAQPTNFNGTATWVITHQGTEFTANISYQNESAFGIPKYKGTIINDTTFVGGFIDIPVTSIVNGKISKDGNRITCSTATTDPAYSYVHVAFDLSRK